MSEWDQIVADLHNSAEVERAVAACAALDKGADESRLPQLYQLLTEGKDFFIREAAAAPISRLEGLRALPCLLRARELGVAENHDNDGLDSIIMDLVSYHSEEAVPMLLAMSSSPSAACRADAAWLLGFCANAASPEPLVKLAQDNNSSVRSVAIASLASFGNRDEALNALLNALQDNDEQVRIEAASALGYYGDRQAKTALRGSLFDSSDQVRSVAKHALRQLRSWFK